jgi:hypothetical protein
MRGIAMTQKINAFGIALAAVCAVFVVAVAFSAPNGFRLPTAAELDPYIGIGTATATTGADCADQKKS